MGQIVDSLMADTKKLGRLTALVVVLAVAGTLSIMMALRENADMPALLESWMDIGMIAIVFYFTAKPAITEKE